MRSDERERSFEHALASHLRADGAPQISGAACSDAEMLAAYHEGALAADQSASLKTHLAGCDRCQQVLAHLQATDEIPAMAATESVAASAQLQAPAERKSVRVLHGRKNTAWRWVVPAGALAAVLLIWITARENRSLQFPLRNSDKHAASPEVAKNIPRSSAISQSAPTTLPPETTPKKDASATDAFSAVTAATGPPAAPKPQLRSPAKDKSSLQANEALSAANNFNQLSDDSRNGSPAPAPERRGKKDAQPLQAASTADSVSGTLEKSEVTEAKRKTKTAESTSIASANRDYQPGLATAAAAPPRANPSGGAQATTEPAAVGGVTQGQDKNGRSPFGRQAEVRLANSIGDVTISAPGERVSWRIGQAGLIGFSSDNEKSWTVQQSGVIADLLAGSASSDQVCWIVGRSGTILRTTDGGAHWQKIRPPAQDDFRSIFAVNARQATVPGSSASFQTIDGGLTWHKVPTD
jgi:hypothetical protein